MTWPGDFGPLTWYLFVYPAISYIRESHRTYPPQLVVDPSINLVDAQSLFANISLSQHEHKEEKDNRNADDEPLHEDLFSSNDDDAPAFIETNNNGDVVLVPQH